MRCSISEATKPKESRALTSRMRVTVHEAAGPTSTMELPGYEDMIHVDYLASDYSSGRFDVAPTTRPLCRTAVSN